jgi:hypothetical protein
MQFERPLKATQQLLFSAIASDTASSLDISLTEVNWLGNIVCALYLVVSWFVPLLVGRWSVRAAAFVGAGSVTVAGW